MKFIKLTEVTATYEYSKELEGRHFVETTNPIFVHIERALHMKVMSGKGERRDYTRITFGESDESIACADVLETPEEIMARFS